MPLSNNAQRQNINDLLIKGLTCALIGLVVLVAPFFMQASDLRNIFLQAHIVGWFALVLGLAFLVQGLLRRHKAKQASAQAAASDSSKRRRR